MTPTTVSLIPVQVIPQGASVALYPERAEDRQRVTMALFEISGWEGDGVVHLPADRVAEFLSADARSAIGRGCTVSAELPEATVMDAVLFC